LFFAGSQALLELPEKQKDEGAIAAGGLG